MRDRRGYVNTKTALKVSNIRLPVEEPESSLPDALARRLGIPLTELTGWRILRKSLDARSRSDLRFVYSAVVEVGEELPRHNRLSALEGVEPFVLKPFDDPEPGDEPLSERPVIVGSGPAGLLAGYFLAQRGYRPLILERGHPVKDRVPAIRSFDRGAAFDGENNYLFGEGGAGCFSDGKLTCRISGPDVDWVLERFVESGGRPSIMYEHRPHLGSNKLPLICRNLRRTIEASGGEFRFNCRMEQLDIRDGRVTGVATSSGFIATSHVILAIGHSARDTYEMLHELGVPIMQKAFQLGLRIEQPQDQVNQQKYGRQKYLDILGEADYSLVARGAKDVFTFCMCAGGVVIPSISESDMFCSNGMSNSRHDTPFANSGLVVTLSPDEFESAHPLAGVELQRQYEAAAFRLAGGDYHAPVQRAADFVDGRSPDPKSRLECSYARGTRPVILDQLLPPSIARAIRVGLPIMDGKWRGRFVNDAVLVGPEMRGSSPVRIERDQFSRQCPEIEGFYPVGEGAGYAGGIVTAAVDGLRTARVIAARYAPLEGLSG